MEARKFWKSFSEQIKEKTTELEKYWDLKDTKSGETKFTKAIKEVIKESITKAVKEDVEVVINKAKKKKIQRGAYVLQNEYYRIDVIGWEQKKDNDAYKIEDGIEKYQLKKHAWDFDIAVEHENASNDWSDEVIKLAYISCSLRVVIGYFPYIGADKKIEMQKKYLDAITGTIKTLKCRENMKHGEFMIILGDVGGNEADDFKKLEYTPYLYNPNPDKEEFELLKEEN